MPIDSTNQARLRAARHSSPRPALFTWELTSVATALVNQSAFAYPLAQLSMDNKAGDWNAVRVGMLYRITDGSGNIVTTGVVRKTPDANTFYLSAISNGDPGVVQYIARPIQDNHTITVYNYYPIWTMLSRIENGVFYKRWDAAYTNEGSSPAPVCNMGAWKWAIVNAGESAQITFSASNAFAWGTSIVSYQWTLPAGVTLVSGTLTSVNITVEAPAGFYLIELLVTDSRGVSTRGIRPMWVAENTGLESPFSTQKITRINSDRQDLQGRSMTFEIYGQLTEQLLYRGGAVLFAERPRYNGQALDPGVGVDTYVGFVVSSAPSGNWRNRKLTIETRSPFNIAQLAPMVPQAVIEAASPANWTEVATGFGSPNFVMWYLMAHHCPNLLLLFDYLPPNETPPRKKRYGINGTTLGGQMEEVAAYIAGNVGSASDGTVYFRRNPNAEDNTYRNAMDARITLTDGDFTGEMQRPLTYNNSVGQYIIYGWLYNGDEAAPVGAISGQAQGQGAGRTTGATLVLFSEQEAKEKVGHLHQIANAAQPFRLTMKRNFDIFDPAQHMTAWFALNVSAQFDPYNVGYSGRAQAVAVDRAWRFDGRGAPLKEIAVTFVPETYGLEGRLLPNARDEDWWDEEITPPDEWIELTSGIAFAFNDQDHLARTFNFVDTVPHWENIKGDTLGTVNGLAFDYSSSFFLSGLFEGDCGAWIVTVSGTALRIYYTSDILADYVAWTLQKTYTMDDSTVQTSARIASDPEAAGVCWVAWRCRTGTRVAKTTDGSTWDASPASIGNTTSDSNHDDAPIALCVTGGYVYTTVRHTDGTYTMWRADTTIGSFSEMPNCPHTYYPYAMAIPASDDSLYLGMRDSGDAYDLDASNNFLNPGDTTIVTTEVDGTPTVTTFTAAGPTGTRTYRVTSRKTFSGSTSLFIETLDEIYGNEVYAANTSMGGTWIYQNNVSTGNVTGTGMVTVEWLDGDLNVLRTSVGTNSINLASGGSIIDSFDWGDDIPPLGFMAAIDRCRYIRRRFEVDITGTNADFTIDQRGYHVYIRTDVLNSGLLYVQNLPSPAAEDYIDVTPEEGFAPTQSFALATNGFPEQATTILSDFAGDVRRLYDTIDGGASWEVLVEDLAEPIDGIRRLGDDIIAWGSAAIYYSDDGGANFYEALGDWTSRIGTPGLFLGVSAIL